MYGSEIPGYRMHHVASVTWARMYAVASVEPENRMHYQGVHLTRVRDGARIIPDMSQPTPDPGYVIEYTLSAIRDPGCGAFATVSRSDFDGHRVTV